MVSKIPMSWSKVVPSRPSAVEDACQRIIDEMDAADFNSEDIFAVHLALEEAFSNAVRHGNDMNPDKKVKVEYLISSDRVEISVTDEGEGFNPDKVPDPRYGENLYKCDGRGILLIHSYMDVIKFNERGNRVDMIRYKGGTYPIVNNSIEVQ